MIGENNEGKIMGATEKFLLSDIQTRLAVVEEKQKVGEKDRDELKLDNKELKQLVVGIDVKQDSIKEEFTLMKGKIGGALWLITSLGTALALFGETILKWLKG